MATTTTSLKPILLISLILLSFHFSLIYAHGGAADEDTHAPTSTKDEDHLHSKALVTVKIWCLVIFFVATFIPSMTPYFFQWNESFLVLGTQFSAGVFLATAMMHFLGDANSTFETLTDIQYPFAYMLACAGYLITMSGDLVIAYVVGKSAKGQISVEEAGGVIREEDDDRFKALDHHNPMFIKTNSFGDTLLLVSALCFHSVFEGIAVGIADNKADAWRNLWTISLHKVFAAVAMGIALLRMIPERPFLTSLGYSFAFAVSSPIGVGIGIGIDATTEGKTADWIFAISMSLACGIFVYVAINHLIAKGYKPHSKCYFDTSLYKYLALLLGVAVIAVVMKWD